MELHPNRRRGVAACRDIATQLDVIRCIVTDLNATMLRAAADEPDQRSAQSPTSPPLCGKLFESADLETRFLWAKGLAGDTKAVVLANMNAARALGPLRRLAKPRDVSSIEALARDFPHGQPLTELLRRRVALTHCCPSRCQSHVETGAHAALASNVSTCAGRCAR